MASTYRQEFTFGENFRFAVGWLNASTPSLINASSYFDGPAAIAEILLVQSTIDRSNVTFPNYTEQVYRFVRCPANYLREGKFEYENNNAMRDSIQNAYCVPEPITVELAGNVDATVQKWFTVSVRPKCAARVGGCLAAERSAMSYFFGNTTSVGIIADPKMATAPITYDFQMFPFGRSSNTRNTVENVTLSKYTMV